jgi:CPA1 family monovalent cation:H+ antiporter
LEATVERIAFLLFAAAVISMLARRFRLPYTVGLTVTGVGLAFLPGEPIHLTRELVFTAFLPPLIFEASHQMIWKDVRRELPLTGTLATLGAILSAAIMALGMRYFLGWPWESSLLVGILLSATDPIAVIATFRDLGVAGRLRMIVESESLFNDGTMAVLFAVVLGASQGKGASGGEVALAFALTVVGGAVCGLAVGGAAVLLAGRTDDHLVEITFTTIAAYASFLIAEHFHTSGVIATLTAGMLLGNYGSLGSYSDKGRAEVESFWEYVGFVANSLVFLLMGMTLGSTRIGASFSTIAIVVALMLVGRAVAVYPSCALFLKSRSRLPIPCQHVLFWGGLRGALALALVLGLPESFPGRQEIVTVVFAVVAFSVLLQGVTVGPLMKWLGIARSDPLAAKS